MSAVARQDITTVEEQRAPAAAVSMMDIIAQAVRDPNLDVDKLERLTGLYERLNDRQAEVSFNDAMNAAQAELGPIAADAHNPQTKSRYASYPQLDRAIRPIYAKHGFSLSFGTSEGAASDYVRVTCRVSHRDGYSRDYHVDMPADGKGAKGGDVMTKTHAVGAAMSYGQRYLLKMIFNIAVGEDVDGNAPSKPKEMSEIAKRAIVEINEAETPVELAAWKKNKADGLRAMLSPAEMQEVIGLFNRRAASLKEAARGA